ncbi:MAG: NAD(+)/NADH kinase [Oscillospiraceae bacterium]|jgi:NAD+ kinase|nr:NAD(+)/NADH kinase [Oscillospiraceae bacterium]
MITTLGLLVNPHRALDLEALLRRIVRLCADRGIRAVASPDALPAVPWIDAATLNDVLAQADALMVIGGDGTILHAAAHAARSGLPILGLHAGRKGFLSETTPATLESALDALCSGDYQIEERMMLAASLYAPREDQAQPADGAARQGAAHEDPTLALNDVVITRGSYGRMIRVSVSMNGTHVGGYHGDGLIVASPTGSTGYSLSTGGPIVSPALPCMLLSPICPHSLQSRQIIVPDTAEITLDAECPHEGGGMLLTVDGREPLTLGRRACVTVRRADVCLRFIRMKPFPFFERLRTTLSQWNV